MRGWRGLLPRAWRGASFSDDQDDAPPGPMPPWHAPAEALPVLRSHRYEHEGAHHRVQVREHSGGGALVIVDARRIARVDAVGLQRLEAWLSSGPGDAAALERELWDDGILTGRGSVRGTNAWDSGWQGAMTLPEIPVVASLEVSEGRDAAADVRALHALAIPHVILRPESSGAAPQALAAVRVAEDLGLVAGIAAPADRLDEAMLEELAALGLDHLSLSIAGGDAETHDAVMGAGQHAKLQALARRAARVDVPLTGELPLTSRNWSQSRRILEEASRLGMLGVTAWALVDESGTDPLGLPPRFLRQVAATLEEAADHGTACVTWAAPRRVAEAGSSSALLAQGPRSDGDFGMRIRLDGSILPPRGTSEPAGTLGVSSWPEIRSSMAWLAFLQQARCPTRCAACPYLALCAVDCPADPEGWA